MYSITVLPQQQNILAQPGENLLQVLRRESLAPDAPCGGDGRCGKCRVMVDGRWELACQIRVDRPLQITLPQIAPRQIMTEGVATAEVFAPLKSGYLLAFDIGTTTVAVYLLDKTDGHLLFCDSMPNPQGSFGADVVSRIRAALSGQMEQLTAQIRSCVESLTLSLCQKAGISPKDVGVVSLVGNPAMQQLFLGICPENLVKIPFAPVLTRPETCPAAAYLPCCENALLLLVPDISGYVGADTVACVLSTGMAEGEEVCLLVDIGTNGEMVLGNRNGMFACSTAAGPALEGANIHFGMVAAQGAIDRVWVENGKIGCHVIGAVEATGICGSGLVDAVAAGMELGLINARGRVDTENHCLQLTRDIFLTQEDIRQVQLAKGAIAAGIVLMTQEMGISLQQIQRVYLAGAFGAHLSPKSACAIGLLPKELEHKIIAVGNAAGSGAKQMARCGADFLRTGAVLEGIKPLELAQRQQFAKVFAQQMRLPPKEGSGSGTVD